MLPLIKRSHGPGHMPNRFAEMPTTPPKPATGSCHWAWKLGPVDGRDQTGLLELTMNGKSTLYGVHRLFTKGKVVGFRVHKWQGDPTMYDIDVTVQPWTCDCPDYLTRRAGIDPAGCKHVRSVRAALAAIGQLPDTSQTAQNGAGRVLSS